MLPSRCEVRSLYFTVCFREGGSSLHLPSMAWTKYHLVHLSFMYPLSVHRMSMQYSISFAPSRYSLLRAASLRCRISLISGKPADE